LARAAHRAQDARCAAVGEDGHVHAESGDEFLGVGIPMPVTSSSWVT
jgi:hypothetical protein